MKSFSQYLEEQRAKIIAWHGGGADFKKFDKSKAHSGEGGAAYGSGVYVSRERGVGEHYRDLSKSPNRTLFRLLLTFDKSRLMKWDSPVSKQFDIPKKALQSVDYDWEKNQDPPARHVFHHLRTTFSGKPQTRSQMASDYFEDQGVVGIVWVGNIHGAPSLGKPTNFAVFNVDDIKILNRYDKNGKERP